jgi:hypothetical protein
MGTPIIDDELWALIEPLLPRPKPRRKKYPGSLSVSDRAALNGIPFVFKTGVRWCDLSTKLEFGSGPTCSIFSRATVDSSSVRAAEAGEKLARTPRIARDPVPSTTAAIAIALIVKTSLNYGYQ